MQKQPKWHVEIEEDDFEAAESYLSLIYSPKVVVADGYHRLCAVYEFHEDTWIPCRIV